MRLLVVCIGNICRSPMGEGILRLKAKQQGLDIEIDSAATESYHVGEAPHLFAQLTCMQNGVDISDCRARLFVAEDLDRYDVIYAMAKDVYSDIEKIAEKGHKKDKMNKVDYFLNALYPGCNGSIPDPWFGPEEGYKDVFDLIGIASDAIIKKYKS